MKFIIPGQPQAAERPRIGRYGNFYSPSSKAQKQVGLALMAYRVQAGKGLFEGFLSLKASFYLPAKDRRKWDLDNLLKFVMDAGNKTLWDDDSRIVFVSASKKPDANPRTEIEIEEIK